MTIDMELYKTFYHVAKNGNISHTAEELFISQPAVSYSIKLLEDMLKVKLFLRHPKGVKLTREGELLYAYVEEAYNLISSAEKKINAINNVDGGEIAIGADDIICKYYLLPYIEKFHNEYPNVKIKTFNYTTYNIISGIRNGSISLGVVKTPVDYEGVDIKDCFDINFCFVVGKKHKDLSKKKISLDELSNLPFIMLDKTCSSRSFMDEFFFSIGLNIVPEIELSNFDIIAEFAKIGLGVGCVIENFIKTELEKGELYKLNIIEKIPTRKVAIATLKDMPLSKPSETFVDMLLNSCPVFSS